MILELFLTLLSILFFIVMIVAVNGAILLTPLAMIVWGRNNYEPLITSIGIILAIIIWGVYLTTLLDWILKI